MLDIKRSLPSSVANAQEHIAICDLPGFAEFCDGTSAKERDEARGKWYGDMAYNDSLRCVRHGDMSGVAASDAYLAKLESMIPLTGAWESYTSVVGGAPIVPAYLAGHPLNMRARRRTAVDTAPLSIFVELVASADISADNCRKRGAAILALCRALSAMRAVELWVIIAIGDAGVRATAAIKLDTAPLDLARAAHVLTHTSVFRGLGYRTIKERLLRGTWSGQWAFANHRDHRRTARETYRDLLNPGSEVLYIAPIHSADKSVTAPLEWLKEHLATYGGIEAE